MSEPMSDARLAEIRAREAAATPAPWWFDEDDRVWRLHGHGAVHPRRILGIIPEQAITYQILKAAKRDTPYAEYWPNEADGAFIVNSRVDVPDLLAEVDRLRAMVLETSGDMWRKFAVALAARFTRPVPRMVKGRTTDELEDPLPADRIGRAMSTHWIASDGYPSFGMVTCAEAAEVCAGVRDEEVERLRAELAGAVRAGDQLRAENAELREWRENFQQTALEEAERDL